MPVYRYLSDSITPIQQATFSQLGIAERQDLQRLLRDQIEIIAPGTLVISEEFADWDDSKRRIDLLGIDKSANLVVIELKRTEDGGHMELQAVRYAAMVSAMTFEQAVSVYSDYLKHRQIKADAREQMLQFLGWDEPQEEEFGTDVRMILVSAEFSKELMTSVLWLRDRSIDVRCVRIIPYGVKGDVLLDVQQAVPLPEAEDYQIKVRRKIQEERDSRKSTKDYTKYRVMVGDKVFDKLAKRWAIFHVVHGLVDAGVDPELLRQQISWKYLFFIRDGHLDSEAIEAAIAEEYDTRNGISRWFSSNDELIHYGDKTYAVSNQWGDRTEEAMTKMIAASGISTVSFEKAE